MTHRVTLQKPVVEVVVHVANLVNPDGVGVLIDDENTAPSSVASPDDAQFSFLGSLAVFTRSFFGTSNT